MGMLEDIGKYLDAESTALTLGTNLFLDRLGDTPDLAVAVVQRVGQSPAMVFSRDLPAYERNRVELQVRSASTAPETAKNLSETLWATMIKVRNQTLNGASTGYTYMTIDAEVNPSLARRDAQGRSVYSCTYKVWPIR